MIACDKCNQRLEDCECEPGFPYLAFDPIEIYGEMMLSFDQYCAKNGIIGDAKIRFEVWLGSYEVSQQYTEAMWHVKWERFKRITGETPRRARVGD